MVQEQRAPCRAPRTRCGGGGGGGGGVWAGRVGSWPAALLCVGQGPRPRRPPGQRTAHSPMAWLEGGRGGTAAPMVAHGAVTGGWGRGDAGRTASVLCGRSWVQAAVCWARVAAGPAMSPWPWRRAHRPTHRRRHDGTRAPRRNSSASIHAGARAAGVANRGWAGLGLVLGSGADPAQHTPRPPPRQRPPMAPPPAAPKRHAFSPRPQSGPTVPMCAVWVCPAHGPAGTGHHAGRAAPPCPRPRVRPGLPDALPLVAASATRILALVSWAGSGRQPGPGAFCWCQTGSPPEHRHVGAVSVLGSGMQEALTRCKALDGSRVQAVAGGWVCGGSCAC